MMMLSSSYLLCFAIIYGSLLWRFPALGCIAHDAQMLLSFKHNVLLQNGFLGGDVPGFLPSRKNGMDCCESWERVVCNPSTSHVQHLHLKDLSPFNFSSAFLHLYDLNVPSAAWDPLNVSSAALHPLSKLPGLTYLDLSFDTFQPSSVLSSLSKFPAISHIILRSLEGISIHDPDYRFGSISFDEWSQESLKRMRYLDLEGNGITGRLPPHLSNMSNLLYLDLSYNSFTFTSEVIEMSLTSMTSLRHLDLSQMNLSMTTPHFWQNTVANLSRLSSLQLQECSLTQSNVGQRMNWLGKLHNLEGLSLQGNSLRATFPLVLNNLTKLTSLDMSKNMFMGEIPHTLGLHLHSLQVLVLERNHLNGTIPNSLANMSSLEHLQMGNNSFITRFPEWISRLQNLREFSLYSAQLIGSISSSFSLPSKLQQFNIQSNKMTGTISDTFFGDASELDTIAMSNSGLTINVSSTWIPPVGASIVLFGSCNIGGNFPQWTSLLLPDLELLDLSSNGIVGNLPPWFVDGAVNLKELYIYDNDLEGSLPICNIGNGGLVSLDASNNKFTTAQFGECSNFMLLNLENNRFQGSLPHHFGKEMTSLVFLSLENNEFVGTLPDSLGDCSALDILNFANNNFEGTFPRWIFNLHNLQALKLSSNNFKGGIPDEIRMLEKLHFMDLSFNRFYGVIPHGLWNMPALQHKIPNLENEFISFPDFPGFSNIYTYKRVILDFYSKGVHLDYQKILHELTCIDLSHNNLSGRLPINVGEKLKRLRQLNLSHNSFTGPIPESISKMDELESLDLSHNHFFGKIPQGFGGLSALGFLNLSYNNLSGIIPRAGQMQTFDSSRFEGNMNLTDPLNNNKKEASEDNGTCYENDGDSMKKYNVEELLWGLSVGLSFGIGFAGFILTMLFNKAIKTKTLKFMDHVIQVWILNY